MNIDTKQADDVEARLIERVNHYIAAGQHMVDTGQHILRIIATCRFRDSIERSDRFGAHAPFFPAPSTDARSAPRE